MYNATKFSEWLIQQGLVRSEQTCNSHTISDNPVKLKLGMYSDVSKFPFSGGYVWISDCCPQRFVSVSTTFVLCIIYERNGCQLLVTFCAVLMLRCSVDQYLKEHRILHQCS